MITARLLLVLAGGASLTHRHAHVGTHARRTLAITSTRHTRSFAGGVLVIQTAHFVGANGFSNSFWGWGDEDNDLFLRLRWCGWAPAHASGLELCMEHRDCHACRREKRSLNRSYLRARESRSIERMLVAPGQYLEADGLFNANYSGAASQRLPCGVAAITVLRITLRPTAVPSAAQGT